jgi:HPt (histidine-containing phosphotransfer) domain-containing protein
MNIMEPSPGSDYRIDHLLAAVEHDDALARLVASQFLALGDSLPERLAVAWTARDGVAASRLAHEIKGMASMLGAQRLASAAGAVEHAVPAAASPLAALHDEWQRVGRCLNAYLNTLDTTA